MAIKKMVKKPMAKKPMMKSGGASKSLPKAKDGIFTPYGRIKSNKIRNVNIAGNGSSSDVTKTKKDGTTITKSVDLKYGFAPTASQTKTITDKEGKVISTNTKDLTPNRADKKINRVLKQVGRNENDTWSYKKGGSVVKPKMKSGGTKPKAMYGTSMKPGMMKRGGMKKTC